MIRTKGLPCVSAIQNIAHGLLNGQKCLPVAACRKGIVLLSVLRYVLGIPIPCPNLVNEFLSNPVSLNGE